MFVTIGYMHRSQPGLFKAVKTMNNNKNN